LKAFENDLHEKVDSLFKAYPAWKPMVTTNMKKEPDLTSRRLTRVYCYYYWCAAQHPPRDPATLTSDEKLSACDFNSEAQAILIKHWQQCGGVIPSTYLDASAGVLSFLQISQCQ
jgi:hypothetical protein